jgi:hypothetical protein
MAIATAVAMCTNGRKLQMSNVLLGYWLCKKLYDVGVYIAEFLLILPTK